MEDIQAKAFRVGSVQRRTVLQLLLGYCLILFAAFASNGRLDAILVACVLSFLFMLNIPYNLHLLEIALNRLARGLTFEPISPHVHWPLTRLFVLVNMLGQQTGQQVQMEQRNVAYRDQLLQQVSKTAAQEERNRLARDLHDSIKQQIFSIVVSVAAVKARWENNLASARKIVDDIERTAQEAQVEMQALLQQLRPSALENVGLIESLRMQCQALGYRTGAEVTAELSNLPPDELLPLGAQEMIFRIVQEGFANIARHARASHVWLSLTQQDNTLLMEIGDDGQGFDLAQANEHPNTYGGMGLSNVWERVRTLGGTLSVWSLPGKGTTLHLCIPLIKSEISSQKQVQIGEEQISAIRSTRRALRVGRWVAQFAAAIMLLEAPIFLAQPVVILCIFIALAAWLWAQQYRLQVVLELGRKQVQSLALLADSYGILSGILLLGLLALNYFDALRIAMFSPNNVWATLGEGRAEPSHYISAFFASAVVVTYVLHLRYTEGYYRALSPPSLKEKVSQQLQQIVIDWIVWALVIGLVVLQWHFVFWQEEVVVWDIALVMLSVWFGVTVLKSVRVVRWQRFLSRTEGLV